VIGRDAPAGQRICQLWQASFAKTAIFNNSLSIVRIIRKAKLSKKGRKTMKNMKKIVALLLATVMVMAMSITVFAADGDITVNGPVKDAKYQAIKIFDATMSGDAVSYTLIDNKITEVTGFNTIFATTSAGDKTYVTKKDGVTDEAVINWIKANKDAIKAAGVAKGSEVTGEGSSIKLATGEFGYYMVWSSKGDTVAVSVNTTHPEATVNSKLPSTPSIDPEEGKKVDGKDVNTMNVGDTVTFTVTFTATNYEVKDGVSTPINQYVVTDTPNGFDIDENTVAVKVNGNDYAITGKQISKSKAANTGVLTVTIPWDQTTYDTSNTVVVTYDAKLTNKNIANASTNKAKVTYNETPIPGEPEVYTYNYKINIEKVDDADATKKLEGAKFVLKSGDTFYKVDKATGAVTFVADQKEATEVTTDANGAATFEGLKAGTYTLVETVAPAGYNLAPNTPVTLAEVTEKLEQTTSLTVSAQVKDKTGSALPTTGGIGTTMFYVVGSVLVIGAAVVLISKRRMAR